MNLFELTRALVDIESVTENEGRVGDFLLEYVSALAKRYSGTAERMLKPIEKHPSIRKTSQCIVKGVGAGRGDLFE